MSDSEKNTGTSPKADELSGDELESVSGGAFDTYSTVKPGLAQHVGWIEVDSFKPETGLP